MTTTNHGASLPSGTPCEKVEGCTFDSGHSGKCFGRFRPASPPSPTSDWRCTFPRDHGPCGAVNDFSEGSCGACGEERPLSPTTPAPRPIIQSTLCAGDNVARFTRLGRPTYHCGDPECVCMGAPEPAALAPPAAPLTGEPTGKWVWCTPALLSTGVDCDLSARRAGPNGVGHEHFIASLTADAPYHCPEHRGCDMGAACCCADKHVPASAGAPETSPLTDADVQTLRAHQERLAEDGLDDEVFGALIQKVERIVAGRPAGAHGGEPSKLREALAGWITVAYSNGAGVPRDVMQWAQAELAGKSDTPLAATRRALAGQPIEAPSCICRTGFGMNLSCPIHKPSGDPNA